MRNPRSYYYLGLLVVAILSFKPLLIFSLEVYLSQLLETSVKIQTLQLSTLDLHGTIKEKNNLAHIKVNTLYPLELDIKYTGNADAFKVYQPIKGYSVLTGSVYYKDALQVEAELLALGAKTKVRVTEEPENWKITGRALDLDLQKLQEENGFSLATSGKLNIDINITTDEDSNLVFTSDRIMVKSEVYENISLDIKKEDNDFYAWALFKAKNFENKGAWFHYDNNTSKFDGTFDLQYKAAKSSLSIEVEGDYNNSIIMGQASMKLLRSSLYAKDINYNIDTNEFKSSLEISLKQIQKHAYILKAFGLDLMGDFQAKGNVQFDDDLRINLDSQSLGGDLSVTYAEQKVQLQAKKLELSKLLFLLNSPYKLESKLDLEGTWSDSKLHVELGTKVLKIEDNEIKDITIKAEGPLKDLKADVRLQTPYVRVHNSKFHIKDLKRVNLDANVTTPYTTDPIGIKATALHSDLSTSVELNASSPEFSLLIPQADYAKSKLSGLYTANISPKFSGISSSVVFGGSFSYDKVFQLDALYKTLDGNINAELIGEKISVKAKGLRVEKLLNDLGQPKYAQGKFNLSAEGTVDKLNFKLVSKKITLAKKETGVDENLSCQISGTFKDKAIILHPYIQNRYVEIPGGKIKYALAGKTVKLDLPVHLHKEDKSFALRLLSDVNLTQGIKADISFKHDNDQLNLHNFFYHDKRLEAEISVDVKALERYKEVSGQEVYGPIKFAGKTVYENDVPDIMLSSGSLGGTLDIALKDKQLIIGLDKLSAVKIGRLIKKRGGSKHGILSGNVDYNLENKSGSTQLTARDVEIQGIDIDQSIKSIKDMLGLNLYAMGESLFKKRYSKNDDINLSTQVQHIELDVEITPTLIISKDVALATTKSRFAVNAKLNRDGEIKSFEVAILDPQGCAVLTQKLQGNITSPSLVDTKVAKVVLSGVATNVVDTGGKILDAGASVIDTAASFVWKNGLRQDSNVSIVQNSLNKGANIFSSGKDLVVGGKCKVFYTGAVKQP